MRGLATTIVACGLVTACGPGLPGDGRWDAPQLVEMDDREDARSPMVVVDAEGNATAVWAQTDGTLTNLWANRSVPGVGWGTATRIETADIGPFGVESVAADPTGNVIAVWSQYDASGHAIGANRFVPGVGWGTPQLLRQAGNVSADQARVVVDATGNAIAIWSEITGPPTSWSIWSSRFQPATGWAGAQSIAGSQWSVNNPQIAMTPSGIAIAVWSEGTPIPEFPESIGQEFIAFRRYVPGSGWDSGGSPSEGGTQWDKAQFPQVATDPDGNFIIVWEQDGVMARRFAADRGWDMLSVLADGGTSPAVFVDSAGTGTAIWNRGAATFTPDAGWVRSPAIGVGIPSLAVGPPGELFAVWTDSGIRSNRPFGGNSPATIDSSADATGAYVAVDPHGNATAVWQRPDRGRVSIWASTFHPDAWDQIRSP